MTSRGVSGEPTRLTRQVDEAVLDRCRLGMQTHDLVPGVTRSGRPLSPSGDPHRGPDLGTQLAVIRQSIEAEAPKVTAATLAARKGKRTAKPPPVGRSGGRSQAV